jgi:hypothetical protein
MNFIFKVSFLSLCFSAPAWSDCACRYTYEDQMVSPVNVPSPEVCKSLIGTDLSQRYLDQDICGAGKSVVKLGWSCGDRVSEASDHSCADIGFGIVREQLQGVAGVNFDLVPKQECDDEPYRLQTLRPVVGETDDSTDRFKVTPWKQGVRVKYRHRF